MGVADLGTRVRDARKAQQLSQEALAREADLSLNLVNKLERGVVTDPHYSTLAGLARALGMTVEQLVGEPALAGKTEASETGPHGRGAQPPASDAPEEQATKPWPPRMLRFLAQQRRVQLERSFQHLTLRTETLRDQAKKYYEAGDREGLGPVLMDCLLMARGAHSLLEDLREEVEELGDETKEERRLRDRLKHRIADLRDVEDQIRNMWGELLGAERKAEGEAPLKESRPEPEPTDHDAVSYIFPRNRAAR